jgi:uncharacterized protein
MDADARARALIERLARGDFAGVVAGFDPTMSAALPEGKLAEAWSAVSGAFGAFEAIEQIRSAREGDHDIVAATCRFERRPVLARIVFHAGSDRVAGLFFKPLAPPPDAGLPSYVDPSSFTETEVRVGPEPDALAGTLSIPNGQGPFPGVVLVHGSGPHDRDETVGANRPFRDLALGLASAGIAVLRYEKRTKANPLSLARYGASLTVKEETIDDAVLAIRTLQSAPRVDPSRVFVLGHSLGGNVAPRIAQAAPDVRGLVLLAANARPLEDLVLEQTSYLLPLQAPPGVASAQIEAIRAQVARVKSAQLTPETPASELPLGIPAPYWIDLSAHSPTEIAARLGKPILVLQGGRDYQVTTEDLDLWRAALAGVPDTSCVLLPDLNHLFLAGAGKSRPEEYEVPGHVAPEVIQVIATFLSGVGEAPGAARPG